MNQVEYIGQGKLSKIKDILKEIGSKSIMLVTGSSSYTRSGARDILDPILSGYNVTYFPVKRQIPTLETIIEGIRLARKDLVDTVIGLGGGNPLDTAKCIAVLSTQQIYDYGEAIMEKRAIKEKTLPKILIPTTAGSGSEATSFAVVYIDKEKYSFDNEKVLPEYVILDSNLSTTLPSYVTAYTGFDALAQAIESLWSVKSTKESKIYSREAIPLILSSIKKAMENDNDSRRTMLYASNLAGKAINITRTTAPHSVSYPLTSYFDVPHGHAVALTFPSFVLYNAAGDETTMQDPRGSSYVNETLEELYSILGVKTARDAKKFFENIMDSIKLERKLSKFGIKNEDISRILDRGFNPERVLNNPRALDRNNLLLILNSIL